MLKKDGYKILLILQALLPYLNQLIVQMNARSYHVVLLITLSGLIIYDLTSILYIFPNFYFPSNQTLKNLIALFIIWYETNRSSKPIGYINIVLSFITLIGYLFALQHWPYGTISFVGSLSIMLALLLLNAAKVKSKLRFNFIILLFPTTQLLFIVSKIYHLPYSFVFLLLNLLSMGIVVSVVGYKLKHDHIVE